MCLSLNRVQSLLEYIQLQITTVYPQMTTKYGFLPLVPSYILSFIYMCRRAHLIAWEMRYIYIKAIFLLVLKVDQF